MITVSTPHGPASFKADSWAIDEHQLDILASDDKQVASYAPGAWLSVQRDDEEPALAVPEEPAIPAVQLDVRVIVQGSRAAEVAEELRRDIDALAASKSGSLR